MKKNLINIIYIWISVFIAGVINYIYHPIMLKFLSIEDFAKFWSIVWIFNILSVLVGAIWLFIVKEISQDKEDKKLNTIINFWKKELFLLWICIYFLFLLWVPLLSKFLKIDSFLIFAVVWTTVIFSFLWIVFGAFFQAKERFRTLALFNIIWPITKLTFWVIFVLLWFWIYWAIWWFIFSQIVLLILNFFIVSKYLKTIKQTEKFDKNNLISDFKKDKIQILNYFLASLILAVLMNADILFAKHFFDETTAGTYAWVSIIAKFVIFLAMSIETVYYPVIVSEKNINKKKIILVSLVYAFVWIISVIGIYFIWEFVLNILKDWFWNYINLLYLIVIYCILLALLNFLMKIIIAFKKFKINYISYVLFTLFVFCLYIFVNNDIYHLIIIFDIFIFILVLINFLYLWIIKDEQ